MDTMTKNYVILALLVAVVAGAIFLVDRGPSDESQLSAVALAETKFGDFNIDTSISSREVEVGGSFTVNVSVTDQTPDLLNALASGDPEELERYKKPWFMDGVIIADGPVVPGQVYVSVDKASQEEGPEEVAFGSVFTRSGTFTCQEEGDVLVDLDYAIQRDLDDNTPPINPTLDKPAGVEEVLFLGTVECVKKDVPPPDDGDDGSTGGDVPEGDFVYLGAQYLIICPDGSSLSGYYQRDPVTHEVITDAAGNGLDLDTGLPVVCPGS